MNELLCHVMSTHFPLRLVYINLSSTSMLKMSTKVGFTDFSVT